MKNLLTHISVRCLFVLFSLFMATELFAAEQSPQRPSRKPPEQAIAVCQGQTEKASCEFHSHKGLESGVCEYTPDKKWYACKPTRPEEEPKRKPVEFTENKDKIKNNDK